MIDLLERADPARDANPDFIRLRAKVDERIHRPTAKPGIRRPWLNAAIAFGVVSAIVALVAILRLQQPSIYAPRLDGLGEVPGIEDVVKLASGGVQTAAVDGDTIWVVTALANLLQRISAVSGDLEMTYAIDSHVEGVVVGGGYVWLLGYDNGGEVLRFDSSLGNVDLRLPLGGAPAHGAVWFADNLWVSNDQGQLQRISANGEILETSVGELKGAGLGYLWVNDPSTGLISSVATDGTRGEIVIPTFEGLDTMSGNGVRSVIEAGGRLWLLDGDFPWGTNLSVFDPATGELESFGGTTFGLLAIVEFEGSLWVTSHTDHLLIRVDPETGEVTRFSVPGKAGGVFVADSSLWVSLYHPGSLVRVDPAALLEAADIVVDDWDRFPHRLLCTGDPAGPRVILEPNSWIDYGSWSVIQAQLSAQGFLVCANGFVDGDATPAERAAALDEGLTEAGISGPYVLVAAVDGVHSARLFAEGRSDIAGVVLVDPIPIGFGDFYDELLPDLDGHPPWADLEETVAGDLGDTPLLVIGHDPTAVFLSRKFIEGAGAEAATTLNRYWREGLEFYSGLSTNSRPLEAEKTGLDYVLWDRPDLVVEAVIEVSTNP